MIELDGPLTMQRADELLHRNGRPIASRKVGNNTVLHRREGSFALRLHQTDVVTVTASAGMSRLTLNTGGWQTRTTRERMEWALSHRITTHSGLWLVDGCLGYQDGMSVFFLGDQARRIKGHLTLEENERRLAHNQRVGRLIDRYVRRTGRIVARPCGMCMPLPYEQRKNGFRIVGDVFGEGQHLVDHMLANEMPDGLRLRIQGEMPESERYLGTYFPRYLRKYLRNQLYLGVQGYRPSNATEVATQAARDGLAAKWEAAPNPDAAKRAHMTRLALASSRKRRTA